MSVKKLIKQQFFPNNKYKNLIKLGKISSIHFKEALSKKLEIRWNKVKKQQNGHDYLG